MKVLITGAAGQLGRALVDNAPAGIVIHAARRQDCDLIDNDAIIRLIRETAPEFVINAAAYTAVDKAESDEAQALAINAHSVGTMAEVLARSGGRLAHLSTDFVFDGSSPRAYRPDDVTNPISAYGRTKAAGEVAAGDDAIILRTAWVYSAGGTNFVRTMLRLMAERDTLTVVADQIGSPTWAPGLAQVLWGLVTADARGTFHHSDAGIASWYDFAVAIHEEARALGMLNRDVDIVPITTKEYPVPAARPAFSVLDSSATREFLGDGYTHWRANLREMLKEEMNLG